MGIYECPWIFMGIYGFLGVYRYLLVSMSLWYLSISIWFHGCLDIYRFRVSRYLWVSWLLWFIGFWVSMSTYGWHECLWVLYFNIENISYFIIQEPQKILKFQKTSEITHVL